MSTAVRPSVRGKFLFVGGQKLYVRGVTYGTFRPDAEGYKCGLPEVVERDFAVMSAHGINAVRTYTVPPRWFLDAASRHDLYVMVGLPWEQHVAFLDERRRASSIEARVRAGVRACAGHPAVLCYAVGNEIPGPIVRWHGHHRMERFLKRLYLAAKEEDTGGLVTYVTYPTTEYLQLPFVDFTCFNVFLESRKNLTAYLARLQSIAGDRPLVLGEIGLDSLTHGEEKQAVVLDSQIRTVFAAGCAGVFVFAWTDEWYVNYVDSAGVSQDGRNVDDWSFGLTGVDRRPKPALAAVRRAFADVPFRRDLEWPRVSVVVCSNNGARTIHECFEGLRKLDYPNFEVIVVSDGSTDATETITREYGFRLISTHNRGLSSARNRGIEAATGEIVAYIDDDAYPDPHWLTYLAASFQHSKHAGIGGPNVAPPGDGLVAECVSRAPGGPIHVLLSDEEAEHIPGCNMAFRKPTLEEVGKFDSQFRIAGDDVDLCWKLREKGQTLGFSPGAVVWHHRRDSVRAYAKQQLNYGKAEALLEAKWPEKYNGAGHPHWAGRMYGSGLTNLLRRTGRIYHGVWGSAPFQSVDPPPPGWVWTLPAMPEWYLVVAALAVLASLGLLWKPLFLAAPLLVIAAGLPLIRAVLVAVRASFPDTPRSHLQRLKQRSLTAWLHLVQPLARLAGRMSNGLAPWRGRKVTGFVFPKPRTLTIWNEDWRAPSATIESLEAALRASGACVIRGGDYDRWDLEVRKGTFGAVRLRMAIEEHGAGRQLTRMRCWAKCSRAGLVLTFGLGALSAAAGLDQAWIACAVLGAPALLLGARIVGQCGGAAAAVLRLVEQARSKAGAA